MRAGRPDNSGADYQTLGSEIQAKQQALFEQFNQEIERSFAQQQQNLDEIFGQTAKHFMDINNRQQTDNLGGSGGQPSRSAHQDYAPNAPQKAGPLSTDPNLLYPYNQYQTPAVGQTPG